MTATREISRPSNRSSMGSAVASSLPPRNSHSRTNSSSLGSLNPAHRVSRRKSVSTTAANNVAAMAAAVGGADAAHSASRRTAKNNHGPRGPPGLSGCPSMPNSLPNNGSPFVGPSSYGAAAAAKNGSVVTDGPPLASIPDAEKGSSKSRTRRASEGSRVTKEAGKRASGSVRCEKCGKGYKHSSCLTKHLWEHTPEWAITSKLLISKHQQVQLLEAASVLVNMNQEAAAEAVKAAESDHSSASPAASGSSDYRDDGMSSAETTPPPHDDVPVGSYTGGRFPNKRFSSNSSAYSQSYQSTNSVFSESAPHAYLNHHHHQQSSDGRPNTSGTSATAYDDEDQADLAAAVGLLSCSYGTPQSKPVMLPPDIPPVPPLPARFVGQNSVDSHPGTIPTPPGQQQYATSMRSSFASRHGTTADDDVDMEDDDDDYDRQQRSRGRSDEDDEGMFGRMEE